MMNLARESFLYSNPLIRDKDTNEVVAHIPDRIDTHRAEEIAQYIEGSSATNAALLEALQAVVTIFDNGGTINEAAREATEAIRKATE